MKEEILSILHCPHCRERLRLDAVFEQTHEIRRGRLACEGPKRHQFAVEDGIIRFAAGFDHEAVQREIAYENATYTGQDHLTDPELIAQFPDTLTRLWPNNRNFGPDFRGLIDQLAIAPGAWVLDIGTAACWSTRLLAERGARAIALDVNEANYYGLKTADILFARHPVYFERILESMTHLPFRNASIGNITFNASFHHTPDLRRTLRECCRVLQPGGRIAMVNEGFVSVRHRYFCRSGESTDAGSHHEIAYRELEAAARELGLAVQYRVVHHVRQTLQQRLTPGAGNLAVGVFERFPFLLKQLKSVLVLLDKPARPEITEHPHKAARECESDETGRQRKEQPQILSAQP